MKTQQEIQTEFLEKCVRECKIFIDTSSFLEEGAAKFFHNIVPILERERKALIVPKSVGLELMKLANNPAYCRQKHPDSPNLNRAAINACDIFNRLKRANLIEIYADDDDKDFADHVFVYVFTKMRMKYNMLLITQDKGLAGEVIKLGKDSAAVRGVKKIIVQHIGENGFLHRIFDKPTVKQD